MHLARLARVEPRARAGSRAELLANAIFHRAREVVVAGRRSATRRCASDPGLRSILESSLYSKNVTFAAIVDANGVAVAHADPALEGPAAAAGRRPRRSCSARPPLVAAAARSTRARAGTSSSAQPLLLGDTEFGSIRIGVSTLLIRDDLNALRSATRSWPALVALGVAVFGAMAARAAAAAADSRHPQRPDPARHAASSASGSTSNQDDEFGELGTFFNTVSAQLSADRSQMAGQVANLESAVEHLEDAVAIVNPNGELLFANPAAEHVLPGVEAGQSLDKLMPADHPLRRLAEETLVEPAVARAGSGVLREWARGEQGERLILDASGATTRAARSSAIMLIVRNLEYLSQVQSTVRYSRKLAALGRLSAGVAHEVKNPLNAMMIHLELLRQQFQPSAFMRRGAQRRHGGRGRRTGDRRWAPPTRSQHVDVIAAEIRRLDEVVQGFLKFTRPEDLKLQPVVLADAVRRSRPDRAARSGSAQACS